MEFAIVLSDDLLKEYYKFKHNGSYDNESIQNLFNYYKSPHITNISQLKRIDIEDSALFSQLLQSNLTQQTLVDLCDKTTFKVILNQEKSNYPYVSILGDTLENNYTSTYKNSSRVKAQEHIEALMKNANNIFIYDKYFENNWNQTRKFFENLVPKKRLTIFYKENHFQNKKTEIKNICQEWTLKVDNLQTQHRYLHDRYLIIDNKIEIILTSGFDYLFDESKDFTYIVREK